MRPHSLTGRFLLTLLLSATLPFLVIGWFALGEMRRGLETEVAEIYLPRWADNAALRVSNRLSEILQACAGFEWSAREALARGDVKNSNFERQVVQHRLFLSDYVDLVLLVDSSGTVVWDREGNRLDSQTKSARAALLPESVEEEQWFLELQRFGRAWVPWGRSNYMHRDVEHDSKDPSDYTVGYAMRVGLGEEWGALFVLIRCQEFQDVLDEERSWLQEEADFESAEVFLIDSGGTVLAHTDREQYRAPLQPMEFLGEMLAENYKGSGSFTDSDSHQRRAGFATLPSGDRPWWLGVHATEYDLFDRSLRFARTMLLIIGIVMIPLIVWSMLASRRFLRPVRELASATEAVAKGDLTVRVPTRGQHELADLGRAFNAMAEDLSVSRDHLKQAERQAAWAEMARQVAHEIKNPLTPMRMSAQLLLKAQREEGPRVQELTDRLARTVLEQTDALDRIASDFRQFAGSPSRELKPIAINDLLEGIEDGFGAMAEGRGVKLVVHPVAVDAVVEVDEQEFRRVFLNLLHNAMAACGTEGEVELSSALEGDAVVFRVSDSGPGVPAELRDRLFEPYFTTKSSGTGLGLAICRRIVEAHSGSIDLESSRPGRTVFRVKLPAAGSGS